MWTTVHREVSPWDAHIVAGRLQAEGVHAVVLFEHCIFLNWSKSMVYGMVPIQVPHGQAGAARQVLQSWRQGDYEAALAAELALPGEVRCPRCSGYQWQWRRDGWSRMFAVLMFVFPGGFFSPELSGRRCGHCGLRQSLAEMDGGEKP